MWEFVKNAPMSLGFSLPSLPRCLLPAKTSVQKCRLLSQIVPETLTRISKCPQNSSQTHPKAPHSAHVRVRMERHGADGRRAGLRAVRVGEGLEPERARGQGPRLEQRLKGLVRRNP